MSTRTRNPRMDYSLHYAFFGVFAVFSFNNRTLSAVLDGITNHNQLYNPCL